MESLRLNKLRVLSVSCDKGKYMKNLIPMRFIASHILCVIVSTVVVAMLAGACISPEPATSSKETALANDGPFANTQALIDYWSSTSTSGALTQIYFNGRQTYERSGFGPALLSSILIAQAAAFLRFALTVSSTAIRISIP